MQTNTQNRQTLAGAIAYSLWWLGALALGFWALYLTVLHREGPWTNFLRLAAVAALTVFIIWTRWLRSNGRIPSVTGKLLILMPLAELAVHLMLMPHPGIAFPVCAAVILLFESFFRTGGGK